MPNKFHTLLSVEPESENSAYIRRQLMEYNLTYVVPDQHQLLSVYMRDEHEHLAGGLLGSTYWGWLVIDILWLREDLRGQGYGSRLLIEAEEEALRRGCKRALVDTLDFQTPNFYLKHGYTLLGQFPT